MVGLRPLVCLAACSIAGCGGSSGSPDFGSGATPARPQDDAGATGSDAGAPLNDAGGGSATNDVTLPPVDEAGVLFVADATTTRGCVPGTYVGTFDCTITAILGLIQIPWKGPMSLTLTSQASGAGEFQMLTIAPGAHILGTDQYDGGFSANLSGTLDCATQKLTGALDGNYQLMMGLLNVNAMFAGSLAADYAGNAAPPSFTNGVMGPLASPQWGGDGGFLGTCTWSAALK